MGAYRKTGKSGIYYRKTGKSERKGEAFEADLCLSVCLFV